ncbi:MAG: Crp/Fnr family transcriptional regulator [Bacteroidota bacterium]
MPKTKPGCSSGPDIIKSPTCSNTRTLAGIVNRHHLMLDNLEKILPKIKEFVISTSFEKGDFLFKQGEICKKLFFIEKGICRKYYLHDGKEITTEFLFPENFAISAKSFVLQQPSNEYVQAVTKVEALSLLKSDFEILKKNTLKFYP